jgi:hypothetical protein
VKTYFVLNMHKVQETPGKSLQNDSLMTFVELGVGHYLPLCQTAIGRSLQSTSSVCDSSPVDAISTMQVRPYKAYNNCYLLRAEEDTREEWSAVTWRAMSCLMTGGGIGIDYSRLRPAGKALSRTGGTASGPIPLMSAINEIGRNVMQGGSRGALLSTLASIGNMRTFLLSLEQRIGSDFGKGS